MSASLSQTEEQADKVSNRSIHKGPTLCEECKSNPRKYKCPIHSCSLPCVKAHKARTGCTSKRNHTQFVPLSQFDDNILLSGTSLLLKLCILPLNLMSLYIYGSFGEFLFSLYIQNLRACLISENVFNVLTRKMSP